MTHTTEIISNHANLVSKLNLIELNISNAGTILINKIATDSKIFICGNGGSAADAQHFAAEITGRFLRERRPLPAIALTTDTSAITAIGNDYGFDFIFSRQLEALARPGDLLVGISTSGNSRNVLEAVKYAKANHISTIGLLGRDGGELRGCVDLAVIVPSDSTARIQEMHILIVHIWCELLDTALFP